MQRTMDLLHLGTCNDQPCVVFDTSNAKGISFTPPHGTWSYNVKLREVLPKIQISGVDKDSAVLEVCFHFKGDVSKAWTMYCGSLDESPGLMRVVAWQKKPDEVQLFSEYCLGADPQKNIFAVKL